MSIKIMSDVWARSRYGGERLLLMLAIADAANESNGCTAWPSMAYLGKKTRVSGRYVTKLIKEMCDEPRPELKLVKAGGGRSANTYLIMIDNLGDTPEQVGGGVQVFTPEHTGGGGVNTRGGVGCTGVHPNRNSKRNGTVSIENSPDGEVGGETLPVYHAEETHEETVKLPTLQAPGRLEGYAIDAYPVSVRAYVERVAEVLRVQVPFKVTGGKMRPDTYWIKGAGELRDACGDAGPDVINAVAREYPDATFATPASFVNLARVVAGRMRSGDPVRTNGRKPVAVRKMSRGMEEAMEASAQAEIETVERI